MHDLYIDAEFRIGDAWYVSAPSSYKVHNTEPMMKGGLDLSELPQYAAILIALQQADLLEWARSTAYDELWTYLKGFFQALPENRTEPKASLKVKDGEGRLRVSIEGVTPQQFSNAKITLKDRIAQMADGSTAEEKTIEISLSGAAYRER
jgi:hypothetical protein